jgi:hypothetical protein
MVILQHPLRGQPAIKFCVEGQTLYELEIFQRVKDGKQVDLNPFNSEGEVDITKAGKLMAAVGSAIMHAANPKIGKAPGIIMRDLVYSWQATATIQHRAATRQDIWLEKTELVILDSLLWTKSIKCPACGGSDIQEVGAVDKAAFSKGLGKVNRVYTCCKRRQCKAPQCISWLDNDQKALPLLPSGIRNLIPIVKSDKTGIPTSLARLFFSLPPEGVPFNTLCNVFNESVATEDAELLRAFYLQTKASGSKGVELAKLDSKHSFLNDHYLIDLYCQHTQPVRDMHAKLQQTLSSRILKIDGNFKVRCY